MDHGQWHRRITQALASANRKSALRRLERLASDVESRAEKSIGEWHLAQTRAAVATIHSDLGDHRAAAAVLLSVAEHHRQELEYQRRAFVSASASAALALTAAGDRPAARRIVKQAASVAATLRPPDRLFQRAQRGLR